LITRYDTQSSSWLIYSQKFWSDLLIFTENDMNDWIQSDFPSEILWKDLCNCVCHEEMNHELTMEETPLNLPFSPQLINKGTWWTIDYKSLYILLFYVFEGSKSLYNVHAPVTLFKTRYRIGYNLWKVRYVTCGIGYNLDSFLYANGIMERQWVVNANSYLRKQIWIIWIIFNLDILLQCLEQQNARVMRTIKLLLHKLTFKKK
jgi:hypothetical protein